MTLNGTRIKIGSFFICFLILVFLLIKNDFFIFTESPKRSQPMNDLRIVIDTKYLQLYLLEQDSIIGYYPVAVGKPSNPSPVGDWKIVEKDQWSGGFGTHWLRLDVPFGQYGIHGTNKPGSIGSWASHGCIRMLNRDIAKVYRMVHIGTPVHIIGDPFFGRRCLVRGEKGADVYFLQKRLRQLGLLTAKPDGIFGYNTEQAINNFQRSANKSVTGQVGWAEYRMLQLLGEE